MPTLTPEEVSRRYRLAKERRAPWESHWSEWHWFDLTVGLTLSSVSEELICRAVVAGVLLKRGHSLLFTFVVSSLLFAGAHWSKGSVNIVGAFIWGMFFLAMYLKARSIWPGAIVHTIDNFFVFK